MIIIPGGVTTPKGFLAAGFAAGIKPGSTKRDCAMVVSETDASVSGVFTTNVVKAPAAQWSESVCRRGFARGVVVNSGNANVCTGAQGEQDTRAMAERAARAIGAETESMCVASTGVIGLPLPMDRVLRGIDLCAAELRDTGGHDAALAIMTTDTVPKEHALELDIDGHKVRLGGIAKGSGMIAPNMATMICILTTDANIDAGALQNALGLAARQSFNRICVDNDMSTSDTLLLFANGQSGAPRIVPGTEAFSRFQNALDALCLHFAHALVRDGEGATKFVEIQVEGAPSEADAARIARAIAYSHLCKTAFYGQDPNWGRFACAAGYAGVPFDPAQLSIWLDDLQLASNGGHAGYAEADAAAIMKNPEFKIRLSIGDGPGRSVVWTSDLSADYVKINADYRS